MKTLRTFGKYAAFARIAAAQARCDRSELYGRMTFFVVILGVFSSLWAATGERLAIAGGSKTLIWYLAGTEWIFLSAPLVHVEIQEAFRRGDVACLLGRPVSFVGAMYAEGLGLLVVRAPVLAVTAFFCAWAFTGWVPPFTALALVAAFGLVASALLMACYLGIGLLAFWLTDVVPVIWVWQKLLFVLGGLMLPIGLYPQAMQRIAALSPFPVMLAAPASYVLEKPAVAPDELVCRLALWAGVTAATIHVLSWRARSALRLNGG